MYYSELSSILKKKVRVSFFSILFVLLFMTTAVAREITLSWDPNSEADLSHYIVYRGLSSGAYSSNSGDIGLVTEYSFEIPDDGQIYFFAVTAVNTSELESDFSNEVNTGEILSTPPSANAGPDQNVEEGQQVVLDGSNSVDPDGSIESWSWTQTAGTDVNLSNSTSVRPTFTSPYVDSAGESLTFELTVTDSQDLTSTDTCIVNVVWVNDPPTANAGADQNVEEGQQVVLDGSDSNDPDGSVLSWQWTQTAGTEVVLSNSASMQPTFTSPNVNASGESLIFKLTVTDSQGLKSTDTCIVNVIWINEPPVADAGTDQDVEEGQQVVLEGSGSVDPDGSIVSWQWTQVEGTLVSLSNPASMNPVFTSPSVDLDGDTLTFKLTVTDSEGLKSTDTCIVYVSNAAGIPNAPPVANAGPDQNINEGIQVVLNGSSSYDLDGSIVSWQWTQIGGQQVSLDNDAAMNPVFDSPFVEIQGDTLTFELTVTDSDGLTDTDTCIVNVASVDDTPKELPVANAGSDQNVEERTQVILDGSDSYDPDGSIVSYRWTQIGGGWVWLRNRTSMYPGFRAPSVVTAGDTLTFKLTVTDSDGLTSTDTCIVNVFRSNQPPVANAGSDQNVEEGIQVVLNGSDSFDPDGSIATWNWVQTSGEPVNLENNATAQPVFDSPYVEPDGATLTFELTVTDIQGEESTDFCIVNVVWVNDPPVASAGQNKNVDGGESVTLDGSGSTDSDGNIVSYSWIQTDGTEVSLDNSSAVNPVFVSPYVTSPGEILIFKLIVTDNEGLKSSSECMIEVNPSSQVLTVKSGWNLISISNAQGATPIEDTLEPIMEDIISIWSYDNEVWSVYDPANPEFSDLLEVKPGKGLWVNMRSDAELSVSGIAPLNAVGLSAGWNLIGFSATGSRDVSEAISSITDNVIIVWAYKDGQWKTYDPQNPDFSDLTVMEPGYGYWINVKRSCLWTQEYY